VTSRATSTYSYDGTISLRDGARPAALMGRAWSDGADRDNVFTPPLRAWLARPLRSSSARGVATRRRTRRRRCYDRAHRFDILGRTVQDFQQYGDQWRRVSAHAEAVTGRAYRGGTSIEEVFERGADRLVRHRIYGPNGEILHETFRPYAKFGAP